MSGNAMKKYDVEKLTSAEVQEVVPKMAAILNVSQQELAENLLGSSRNAYLGKIESAGDVDIAWPIALQPAIHERLVHVLGGGTYNTGFKIGSYPLKLDSGKITQVDLMYVKSQKWARIGFYSDYGVSSKYKGAVRNILLANWTILKKLDGGITKIQVNVKNVTEVETKIVYKNSCGLCRIYQASKRKRDGTVTASKTISYEEFKEYVGYEIANQYPPKIIDNPSECAKMLFGSVADVSDIMTAESVIAAVKRTSDSEMFTRFCWNSFDSIMAAHLDAPEEIAKVATFKLQM